MQIFLLKKVSRKNDWEDPAWIFSTSEKLEEFKKKFELEDSEEEMYISSTKAIDPLSL